MKKPSDEPKHVLEEMISLVENFVPTSVLEVGFSLGENLLALKPMVEKLYGLEPDADLLERAKKNPRMAGIELVEAEPHELPFESESLDFVFTSGLLVQVALKDVAKVCSEVIRVSKQYVACIEKCTVGDDRLQEDVGKFYLDHFPELEVVGSGTFSVPGTDGEKVNWWIFRKQLEAPADIEKKEE